MYIRKNTTLLGIIILNSRTRRINGDVIERFAFFDAFKKAVTRYCFDVVYSGFFYWRTFYFGDFEPIRKIDYEYNIQKNDKYIDEGPENFHDVFASI